MRPKAVQCEQIEGHRSGEELSPESALHLQECRRCREEFAVAGWFRRARQETQPPRTLHHPAQLWWRAQILRNLVLREQQTNLALRPIYWTFTAALTSGFFSLALFFGHTMAHWFNTTNPGISLGEWATGVRSLLLFFGSLPFAAAIPALWRLGQEG